MGLKEESEKAGLKLNNQKTKIVAVSPSISWQMDGETMKIVTDFIFLRSKITADGNCSCEIERNLLFGRKAMTNLDSVLKSRDIIFPTKIHLVKAILFPVVMYGCESCTIKKAEHQIIDAFFFLDLFFICFFSYMCSPSRSPLPPTSPSHPSGSSQCTSPEHLSHASNLG